MSCYVEIPRLSRYEYYSLMHWLYESGTMEVDYSPEGLSEYTNHPTARLRFKNPEDAIAYTLKYGGTVHNDLHK